MYRQILIIAASLAIAGTAMAQDRTPAPEGASAYIISPANGDIVTNPVTIVFGLDGMGVAPSGTEKENTGHHHLLINTDVPALDEAIPADDNHVHFGGGTDASQDRASHRRASPAAAPWRSQPRSPRPASHVRDHYGRG